MPAQLTQGALNTTGLNTSSVLASYTITMPGASVSRAPYETTAPGRARVVVTSFTITAPGTQRMLVSFTITAPGEAAIRQAYTTTAPGVAKSFNAYAITAPGRSDISLKTYTIAAPGVAKSFNAYAITAPGEAAIRQAYTTTAPGRYHTLQEMTITAPGRAQYGMGHTITAPGRHTADQPTHTRVYRQSYRVADAALARWDLFVGYGAMPDLMGSPVASAVEASMPIVFTPTYPGPGLTTVLYTVVKKTNEFGLSSFNQGPQLIEIDETGAEVQGPLTAPDLIRVLDGNAVGSLQAWARYAFEGDRDPADTWELYAEVGTDPIVATDTPLIVAPMGAVGGLNAPWRGAASGLTPGAVYHVMAAVRRSSDAAVAVSGVLQITLAVVYDIDAGTVDMFAGDVYEIKQ